MLISFIVLIAGFFLLVKGADTFVDGASGIAKYFKIPSIVIGLTIVSIGTSLPEAAVSITAAFAGSNDIALGNVIGSNIFNTAVVIGVCALIKPIVIDKQTLKKDFPFMLIASLFALFFLFDGMVSRFDGILLLVLFTIFMVNVVTYALKNKTQSAQNEVAPNMFKCVLFSVFGAMLIILGGDFVVNSAKTIALEFGLSEAVIGLTVVAIGTSLPELVTSAVAAKKGESDIALGNVIGSNIFNLLFILGLSSTILPIGSTINTVYDMAIFIAIAVFVFFVSISKKKITRLPAVLLLGSYICYNAYILMR